MTFDDKLNELISEVEVPDELSPANIAKMLKANNAQSKMETEHRNIKSASSFSAQRRTIIMRTAAAAAACAVFAVGMIAFNERNKDDGNIEEQIDYAAVSPDSYDDLYNIYTGIYLDGDETTPADDTSVNIDDLAPEESLTDASDYDLSLIGDDRIAGADIVKTDGSCLYIIKDKKLFIVSLETMEIIAEIDNQLVPPIEMYIRDNTLILVSKESQDIQIVRGSESSHESEGSSDSIATTASTVPAEDADSDSDADSYSVSSSPQTVDTESVSRTNTVIDIYDISDKTNPTHTTEYKQNGNCISSKMVNGVLYTVTGYSNYRITPLDKNTDLDSFVPAFYINGEKNYVAAEDVIVPGKASNTDYSVISAIDLNAGENNINVKAVLGSGKNVYCSADTLYLVGTEKDINGADQSTITSFDLSPSGELKYKAGGTVAGKVINQHSLNEYDSSFRLAASVSDENGKSVSIYIFDDALNVINSAAQLLTGYDCTSVRFEGNYASFYSDSELLLILDMSSNPPMQSQSIAASSAFLYDYSESKILGFGKGSDGLSLTMYSSENGLMCHNIAFASEDGVSSKALTDRRALLVDKENSVIGVPAYSHNEFGTKNMYYIFSYDDENGFAQKGVIEYIDIDDSGIFERAVISSENLYIIGKTRVVSVQLSDMKVTKMFEF